MSSPKRDVRGLVTGHFSECRQGVTRRRVEGAGGNSGRLPAAPVRAHAWGAPAAGAVPAGQPLREPHAGSLPAPRSLRSSCSAPRPARLPGPFLRDALRCVRPSALPPGPKPLSASSLLPEGVAGPEEPRQESALACPGLGPASRASVTPRGSRHTPARGARGPGGTLCGHTSRGPKEAPPRLGSAGLGGHAREQWAQTRREGGLFRRTD